MFIPGEGLATEGAPFAGEAAPAMFMPALTAIFMTIFQKFKRDEEDDGGKQDEM